MRTFAVLACLTGLLLAQNVGIGTATPTERLHVQGNLRLEGAFMPGNNPGTLGQILLSQGAGVPPIWAPNPICTTPTQNRFIKFTSTTPTAVCNTTLAEQPTAPNNIWNADGAASPAASDKFSIYALAGAPWAVNGYSTLANGGGVYGGASGNNGIGVWGNATGGGNPAGVYGTTSQATGWGVLGVNLNAGGTAGQFENTAAAGTGGGDGVIGVTRQSQGFGAWGINLNTNGTGVVGAGNNATATYLTTGSGGAFTGTNTGTYTVATSGTGNALIAYNRAAYSATAAGFAGAFISRSGGGSTVVINLRNDGPPAPNYNYYANTALTVINMRADGDPWGVAGVVANGGAAAPGTGVLGSNTSTDGSAWAVYGNGRLGASGAKAFHIDHPLDPENKYLNHLCTEGPEPYTIYRGVVVTGADGRAIVQLPRYFEALNRPGDYHYALTCIGTFAQAIVEQEIQNNQFVIRTDKPGVKVAWTVTGVRNDVYARHFWLPDEVEKPAEHKGKYLIPELYGKGPEYGIFSSRLREIKLETVEAKRESKIETPVPRLKTEPKDSGK